MHVPTCTGEGGKPSETRNSPSAGAVKVLDIEDRSHLGTVCDTAGTTQGTVCGTAAARRCNREHAVVGVDSAATEEAVAVRCQDGETATPGRELEGGAAGDRVRGPGGGEVSVQGSIVVEAGRVARAGMLDRLKTAKDRRERERRAKEERERESESGIQGLPDEVEALLLSEAALKPSL